MEAWIALVLAAAASNAPSLEIGFIGNAAFVLHDGETTLVTDFPYVSGAYDYMTYEPGAAREMFPAGPVVAVITHRHTDHVDVERLDAPGWSVIGPGEVSKHLRTASVIPLADSMSVGAFTVRPSRTPHADTEHYSYVIEWRGYRLYFSGDSEDPRDLLGTHAIDVAFLTPWIMCAADRAGGLSPATTVLVHHQHEPPSAATCMPHERLEQYARTTLRDLLEEAGER